MGKPTAELPGATVQLPVWSLKLGAQCLPPVLRNNGKAGAVASPSGWPSPQGGIDGHRQIQQPDEGSRPFAPVDGAVPAVKFCARARENSWAICVGIRMRAAMTLLDGGFLSPAKNAV